MRGFGKEGEIFCCTKFNMSKLFFLNVSPWLWKQMHHQHLLFSLLHQSLWRLISHRRKKTFTKQSKHNNLPLQTTTCYYLLQCHGFPYHTINRIVIVLQPFINNVLRVHLHRPLKASPQVPNNSCPGVIGWVSPSWPRYITSMLAARVLGDTLMGTSTGPMSFAPWIHIANNSEYTEQEADYLHSQSIY